MLLDSYWRKIRVEWYKAFPEFSLLISSWMPFWFVTAVSKHLLVIFMQDVPLKRNPTK